MIKDKFQDESNFVRFDGANFDSKHPTVRFRIVAPGNLGAPRKIIDKDGNFQGFYHVKAPDLGKRRRKLLRQDVEPNETEKAISYVKRSERPGL